LIAWLQKMRRKIAIWHFRKAFNLLTVKKKKEEKTNASEI
jgi:hypothetical protein